MTSLCPIITETSEMFSFHDMVLWFEYQGIHTPFKRLFMGVVMEYSTHGEDSFYFYLFWLHSGFYYLLLTIYYLTIFHLTTGKGIG